MGVLERTPQLRALATLAQDPGSGSCVYSGGGVVWGAHNHLYVIPAPKNLVPSSAMRHVNGARMYRQAKHSETQKINLVNNFLKS